MAVFPHPRRLFTFSQKARGLIGPDRASPVWFTTRWGIHTFGLRFPIDVLILDSAFHIVSLRAGLPPNRVFLWPPKYYYVVELPAGSIVRYGLTLTTTFPLG